MDSEKKEIVLPLELARIDEIPEGGALCVATPFGREIALFKIAGKVYALDNACPHMGGPLAEGEIDDATVTCPWHGWQFNIENGANASGLGEDALSLKTSIRDGIVYLDELPSNF